MKIKRLEIYTEDNRQIVLWDYQMEALLEILPALRNLEKLKDLLRHE